MLTKIDFIAKKKPFFDLRINQVPLKIPQSFEINDDLPKFRFVENLPFQGIFRNRLNLPIHRRLFVHIHPAYTTVGTSLGPLDKSFVSKCKIHRPDVAYQQSSSMPLSFSEPLFSLASRGSRKRAIRNSSLHVYPE